MKSSMLTIMPTYCLKGRTPQKVVVEQLQNQGSTSMEFLFPVNQANLQVQRWYFPVNLDFFAVQRVYCLRRGSDQKPLPLQNEIPLQLI